MPGARNGCEYESAGVVVPVELATTFAPAASSPMSSTMSMRLTSGGHAVVGTSKRTSTRPRRHVPLDAGENDHVRMRPARGVDFGEVLGRGRVQIPVGMIGDGHDLAPELRRLGDDFLDRLRAIGKPRVHMDVRFEPHAFGVPVHLTREPGDGRLSTSADPENERRRGDEPGDDAPLECLTVSIGRCEDQGHLRPRRAVASTSRSRR